MAMMKTCVCVLCYEEFVRQDKEGVMQMRATREEARSTRTSPLDSFIAALNDSLRCNRQLAASHRRHGISVLQTRHKLMLGL
jgi:hypothetical protein